MAGDHTVSGALYRRPPGERQGQPATPVWSNIWELGDDQWWRGYQSTENLLARAPTYTVHARDCTGTWLMGAGNANAR